MNGQEKWRALIFRLEALTGELVNLGASTVR